MKMPVLLVEGEKTSPGMRAIDTKLLGEVEASAKRPRHPCRATATPMSWFNHMNHSFGWPVPIP